VSFFWLETATFIAKHIARSPSHVARELSNVSTVRPKFPMLTINQIFGPHSVQSETTLWWRTLCLISKKVGEKREEGAFITYILIIIYIFYVQTKQVHPTSVAYLNNRVLLLMALPCDRLFEEIWCSQQILAQECSSSAYMQFAHQISQGTYHT